MHSAVGAGRAFIAFIFIVSTATRTHEPASLLTWSRRTPQYYAFYNLAMSPLLVAYTVEILPFRIRAKGLVIMNLAVNITLVFNQYV